MDKETILEYFERKYHSLMKLAVMMTKDWNAAEDVLHDVAVVLLKKQQQLEDIEDPAAFLAACIRRATLNYFRKNARLDVMDPAVIAETFVHPEPGVSYDYVEWVISLEQHLKKYAPEIRKAFIEHYLDNVPIEWIAPKLGMTANALSQRFMRMRETLAKEAPSMLRQVRVLSLIV